MKRKAVKMRGMRLSEATHKALVQATKVRSYDSPSSFMRTAIEKELRGADARLDESEQRIVASLERCSKQVRRVSTGQQAIIQIIYHGKRPAARLKAARALLGLAKRAPEVEAFTAELEEAEHRVQAARAVSLAIGERGSAPRASHGANFPRRQQQARQLRIANGRTK